MVLDGRHRVGDAADADALDVRGVVAGAAVVIVLPVRDTVVDEQRQERRRNMGGPQPLDDVVAAMLDIDEVT